MRLFRLWRAYKDGYLPEPGGLNDQPNLLIEAFDELNRTSGILDEEDAKARNSKTPPPDNE